MHDLLVLFILYPNHFKLCKMALTRCRLNYPTKGFTLNFPVYLHITRLNFLLLKGCKDKIHLCPQMKTMWGCNQVKQLCPKTCGDCKYVSKITGSLFTGKKAIVDRKCLIHENVTDLTVFSVVMGEHLSEFRKNHFNNNKLYYQN